MSTVVMAPERPLRQARETLKFALLVALVAIGVDAVIAHGLFWDNDPYWTYWVTKTFLIATVFVIGTALMGTGLVAGLVITAVHTLVLEIYYQWLAPVGLPQEPEWLDFNHLWVTGVPAHYLAILAGYLAALWIWRRHRPDLPATPGARAATSYALVAALLILVTDGLLTHGLLRGDFPGWTYFVQHLLVGFVFLFGWRVYVGADWPALLVGAVGLALLFTGYGMYLGPMGLPFEPPRYLGYSALWTQQFPGALVAGLIGQWGAGRLIHLQLRPAVLARGAAEAI